MPTPTSEMRSYPQEAYSYGYLVLTPLIFATSGLVPNLVMFVKVSCFELRVGCFLLLVLNAL